MSDSIHRRLVMVVEDERDIRECLAEVLEQEGFAVVCAENGVDALVQLGSAERLPGVILLDLLMPQLDGEGFRVLQLQDPRLAAIPTIVVSANGKVNEAAARMGVAAFLRKPLDIEVLVQVVEAQLAGSSPARSGT